MTERKENGLSWLGPKNIQNYDSHWRSPATYHDQDVEISVDGY